MLVPGHQINKVLTNRVHLIKIANQLAHTSLVTDLQEKDLKNPVLTGPVLTNHVLISQVSENQDFQTATEIPVNLNQEKAIQTDPVRIDPVRIDPVRTDPGLTNLISISHVHLIVTEIPVDLNQENQIVQVTKDPLTEAEKAAALNQEANQETEL